MNDNAMDMHLEIEHFYEPPIQDYKQQIASLSSAEKRLL